MALNSSRLARQYKITKTLKSSANNSLYTAESLTRNQSVQILVINLPQNGLNDEQKMKLISLQQFIQTQTENFIPLECLADEGNQLIAVQPFSPMQNLELSPQIKIQTGYQLLLDGLNLIANAQQDQVTLGGLQPQDLLWTGDRLKVFPLGSIFAQLDPKPQFSDISHLASSIIWAMTHIKVLPRGDSHFWQAQVQLEDPWFREMLERLLREEFQFAKDALSALKKPHNKILTVPNTALKDIDSKSNRNQISFSPNNLNRYQSQFLLKSYLLRGLQIFKKQPILFVAYLIFVSLSYIFLSTLGMVGTVIQFLMSGPLLAGFFSAYFKLAKQKSVSLEDFFQGLNHFWHFSLTALLATSIVLTGSFFFIIPGIYFSVAYILALPIVADRFLHPWSALELSRKSLEYRWSSCLAFLIILSLINYVGFMLNWIVLLFSIPWSVCAIAAAYEDIVGIANSSEDA
ncbi:hypothetical protein VZH09_11830 [Synechococcus elongatus IITB7]|uniref:hypothetical protein n=1 Tax=Synechococcus elongatus TaxID=32046 RepID=UPI0030CC84A5